MLGLSSIAVTSARMTDSLSSFLLLPLLQLGFATPLAPTFAL